MKFSSARDQRMSAGLSFFIIALCGVFAVGIILRTINQLDFSNVAVLQATSFWGSE